MLLELGELLFVSQGNERLELHQDLRRVMSVVRAEPPYHAFISVEAFPPRRLTPRFVFTLMQVCFTLETSAMSPGVGIAESLR